MCSFSVQATIETEVRARTYRVAELKERHMALLQEVATLSTRLERAEAASQSSFDEMRWALLPATFFFYLL